jgi:methylated-DNA-[protein]-cysteine S-methyltransferase
MNSSPDAVERALGGFDPPVRPPTLPDSAGDVRYALDDTALGRMLLVVRRDGAVLASTFAPSDADADRLLARVAAAVSPQVLRGGTRTDQVRRELAEYLAGRRRAFDVRLDLTLTTPFQRAVLGRLPATGYGQRTTYGELADGLGRPRAARAVGAALGANPLCVLLPCHRVVASTGALTGYAGGLAAKEALLALESAG